jgi:hypothetical protein
LALGDECIEFFNELWYDVSVGFLVDLIVDGVFPLLLFGFIMPLLMPYLSFYFILATYFLNHICS